MPRSFSEIYVVSEEPNSKTSSGTGNVQSFTPAKRAVGVWISVEGVAARVTFGGSNPGVGTGPGIVIPAGASPQFYPFAFAAGEKSIQFASNTAGSSTMSVIFNQ